MPTVFTIGFVVEHSPRAAFVSECGVSYSEVELTAIWKREDGMSCCEDDQCIKPGNICVPRGDDVKVLFSVYDTKGFEFDLTGATEIVFVAADVQGGYVRFTKRLTMGDIIVSTNGYQFAVTLTDVDTAALVRVHNYYEVQVTNSIGLKNTVSAGLLKSPDTMIKDI